MKRSRLPLLIIILTFIISACSTTPKTAPPQTVSGSGYIKIVANPEDAEVILNGVRCGTAKDFCVLDKALKVDSGTHKIELKKEGHFPYFREIVINNGTVSDINVTLNKQ